MRFAVVAMLNCQQYLAVSLIYAAIPVILRRNGAPLEMIGLFGMVFFAFAVNFLWAPLVDRYRLTRLGRRRSWILVMQIASALAVGIMSLLDPAHDLGAILAVSIVLATLAATQRIATMGYVAEALGEGERAMGAAFVGWGGALGNVIGGAICLYLVDAVGWRAALLAVAGVMLAFAAALVAVAEPRPGAATTARLLLLRILRRRDIWQAIVIVTPATFVVSVAFAMIQPRLVDLGFSLATIGTAIAVIHLAAFTVVGPVAGALARRTPPLRAIMIGALALAPLFVVLTVADAPLGAEASAIAAVVLVFCALAAQTIAFTSFFLGLAGGDEAATEVTVLMAAVALVGLLGFAASGFIAQRFGYAVTIGLVAAGYLATAALAGWPRPAGLR
ncbi:MFS transporter [Reyranella sp. CPCC 100927]|uniref:MFS transporter n=1 Tax=Reyranella sp. CPCC 100927 TaxID=2599616 RepID=UPI0011B81CAB|nr:MFS transporter [Reyranella sp. CPCC 100927]TWT15273.1 MFS transporter [Reyranella sp. CPCC 100927]